MEIKIAEHVLRFYLMKAYTEGFKDRGCKAYLIHSTANNLMNEIMELIKVEESWNEDIPNDIDKVPQP